jgi:ABC-2 type transport system permease protein
MRAACLLFVSSLRRMRALLVASAIIGAMLCVLFGVFNTIVPDYRDWLSLGYTDNDKSALSADFERYLTERLGARLVEADEHTLETELIEKRVSALIEVPAGFGQAVLTGEEGALQTTSMDDYANRVLLQSYLEGYTSSLDVLSGAAGGDEARFERLLADAWERTATVSAVPLAGDVAERVTERDVFRNTIGFFLMIGVLLSIGMANIIYDDRANGTWQRVRASSVSAPSYVAGICSAGFVAALLMVAVLFVYLALAGMDGNLLLVQTLPLCLLFGLFAIAFALVCGLLFKSRNSIYFAVVAVSTISCLLGGAFFPLDTAPQVMQQLAHISPAFWFMNALESLYAGDTTGWLVSAGILALFSLLCFLIAGVTFAGKQAPTPRAGD